jgi:hypothetical protein
VGQLAPAIPGMAIRAVDDPDTLARLTAEAGDGA